MSVSIPLVGPMFTRKTRPWPITPRENLLLALDQKKPLWMPNLYADSQLVISTCCRDMAPTKSAAGYDWFGTYYTYSDAVGVNLPTPGVFQEIGQWREKVKWPDLDAIDWTQDLKGFVRDEGKALYWRMSNGIFERLHAFEGFEQALMDMLTEPEETRAFFERMADYKISLFRHVRELFPLDFIVAADDYGTARAPFFSIPLYRETLLEPTRRFVRAVQETGTRFVAHCCGKIDDFIPIFADELCVDALEIQGINDIPAILRSYGDKLTVQYIVNPEIVYDDEATSEQRRAMIRQIVDEYGAKAAPGSGVVISLRAMTQEQYDEMDDELYEYSRAKYAQ